MGICEEEEVVSVSDSIPAWSVLRQIRGKVRFALGRAAQSARQAELAPRTRRAEVTKSICPYRAGGCGQRVYVEDGRGTQIEGDPESLISRGRLCPEGVASKNSTNPGLVPGTAHGAIVKDGDSEDRTVASRRRLRGNPNR